MESSYPGSHPLSPDSPMHHQQTHTDCLDWDSGYLEYLRDARRGIERCSWASRDWSAPYDGENPAPNTAPPPPPPPSANPSVALLADHFSLHHHPGSNGTPPGQQRAAAATRSEWSSSERDSGEWDVTIGKNSCISLTPRSKKRSLQREELLPKPRPHYSSTSSSSMAAPSLPSHPAASSALHRSAAANTAMYNGTQVDGCSDSQERGLKVKKVKRDPDSNQNGSLVTRPSLLTQPTFGSLDADDVKSIRSSQAPDASPPANDTSNPDQSLQSVESLIQELLEQAPGEPQLGGESNGQGISIEAFTQELRELEDRVKERSRGASPQDDAVAEEPLLLAERPEEQQQQCAEVKQTGEMKGEGAVVGLCSPSRPLYQPTAQPYTGETQWQLKLHLHVIKPANRFFFFC